MPRPFAHTLRAITAGVTLTAAMLAAPAAHAVLVNYTFSGVAGAGTTLDIGGGAVDVSGVAFTASGSTVSDVDIFAGGVAGDGVGTFAATSVYDFGAFGAFATDIGGDFYSQCGSPTAISCILLSDATVSDGFNFTFAPTIAGDPDFGAALGPLSGSVVACITRSQTNGAGHSLTMGCDALAISSATVTAAGVDEPGPLVLLGVGLALAAGIRRRRAT